MNDSFIKAENVESKKLSYGFRNQLNKAIENGKTECPSMPHSETIYMMKYDKTS